MEFSIQLLCIHVVTAAFEASLMKIRGIHDEQKKKSCVHVQQTTFLLLVSSQLEQRLVNESVFIADRSFEKC